MIDFLDSIRWDRGSVDLSKIRDANPAIDLAVVRAFLGLVEAGESVDVLKKIYLETNSETKLVLDDICQKRNIDLHKISSK